MYLSIFVGLLCLNVAACKNVHNKKKSSSDDNVSEKPNIVLVIVDDQDVELGSMNYMKKTLKHLRDNGATFTNSFVTTPMCCPSRSSLLTGLYVHNHHVLTNNDNCSSIQWQQIHEPRSFGKYLNDGGYETGYFGKYLNEYTGERIPPGWVEWLGLIRNTRYYNYSVNHNGRKIRHGNNYAEDYLTDLVVNNSLTFFRDSKRANPMKPVMMVLSMPAPHGPEDAAPQYQHMFPNVVTHRTPSWNFAPSHDKEWLLQRTEKMPPVQQHFTDVLQQKRLQTLLSVDDAVEKLINELTELKEIDNTYVFYTSDHGYHLGQFGIPKGKGLPYDTDVRVPMYVRGPNFAAGSHIHDLVLNIDLAPTFLDIAGIDTPPHMDGKSFFKSSANAQRPAAEAGTKRRNMFLIERGKSTSKKIFDRLNHEAKGHIKPDHKKSKCAKMAVDCTGADCLRDDQQFMSSDDDCFDGNKASEVSTSHCDCRPLRKVINADNDEEQMRQFDFLSENLDESCTRVNKLTIVCNNSLFTNLTSEKQFDVSPKHKKSRLGRKRKMRQGKGEFGESAMKICSCSSQPDDKLKVEKDVPTLSGGHEGTVATATISDEPGSDERCKREGFECARMDNDHWRSPPLWDRGSFCFCPNANNNTYWCLRIIDEEENALYCEFISGFASYYNMRVDPYQLRNAIHDLSYVVIRRLHRQLEKLMQCQGTQSCSVRAHFNS